MIYFVRIDIHAKVLFSETRISLIKIGKTNAINKRMAELKFDYKFPVILLASIPGGLEEEAEMHRRFDHLRVHSWAEWFYPTRELMGFIEAIRENSENLSERS